MTQVLHYSISEVAPYINWTYFFHAWRTNEEQSPELLRDALSLLQELKGQYQTHALVGLFAANSDGESTILIKNEEFLDEPSVTSAERRIKNEGRRKKNEMKIPFLRQQHGDVCLCWADFVRPIASGKTDTIGLFASSVDEGMEQAYAEDEYRHMLAQTLADRLAEATAERMHEEVRKRLWGYAPDEQFTIEEMFQEKYIGRRPAVGYPSLPDQSLNFLLNDILDFSRIGIRLTESGAMRPHASTSGLLFAHPQARHFAIGRIGEDQLQDYAHRRGLPIETMRKFLAANLS